MLEGGCSSPLVLFFWRNYGQYLQLVHGLWASMWVMGPVQILKDSAQCALVFIRHVTSPEMAEGLVLMGTRPVVYQGLHARNHKFRE